MSTEQVVLVNHDGEPIGLKEKMQAHLDGDLHLAFSVLLYRHNSKGDREYLLHQRAMNKYHSGGLWTNTCCSHPRTGETLIDAGARRLHEEMGIHYEGELHDVGDFVYRADLDNALVEHELDHVLIGSVDHLEFTVNPEEVMATAWVSAASLHTALATTPERYTAWFPTVVAIAECALNTKSH
ncbi:isopentenyl-diphosphate Delta-isomerase [Thaumasiovibrio subtropicus]|uniref:isopentenyl-diphosphate Delta-isomerase n=1 Tax=Thaumasiovibrio subtropicus TaxID=1891207 RepID=UPI000B358D1C|nr:isopentenyl-diphosphate Delta-isomerase [Thaumasiovibrio subtropicus]